MNTKFETTGTEEHQENDTKTHDKSTWRTRRRTRRRTKNLWRGMSLRKMEGLKDMLGMWQWNEHETTTPTTMRDWKMVQWWEGHEVRKEGSGIWNFCDHYGSKEKETRACITICRYSFILSLVNRGEVLMRPNSYQLTNLKRTLVLLLRASRYYCHAVMPSCPLSWPSWHKQTARGPICVKLQPQASRFSFL